MAPRPLEIFQKSSPSPSAFTLADVQSAGLGGGSAAAAGPFPLPSGPWHVEQFVSASFLPSAADLGSLGDGFFMLFASAGAFHSGCAQTTAAPATNTAVATATTYFVPVLMRPPLRIVLVFTTQSKLIYPCATRGVK